MCQHSYCALSRSTIGSVNTTVLACNALVSSTDGVHTCNWCEDTNSQIYTEQKILYKIIFSSKDSVLSL